MATLTQTAPDPLKPTDDRAGATLDDDEMQVMREAGIIQTFADGDAAFNAGDADIDLFVVQEGRLDIYNGNIEDKHIIAWHNPHSFVGDIDLLTRRPVIVSAIANSPTTVIRVPGEKLRTLLSTTPKLGEKMLVAFQARRELLSQGGVAGLRVIGHGHCRDTTLLREFLYKNFMPFAWIDCDSDDGIAMLAKQPKDTRLPLVLGGQRLRLERPTLHELARSAGIWSGCPVDTYDLVIVGAGPAGMAAAVYAASEGLKTLALDRLGPGGQAAGSSKIENFIGFPAGLSGTDLATRATLQLLKFGAQLITPVDVQKLEPGDGHHPHKLHLDCGAIVSCRTVLLCTGVAWRKLEVPNADRFERAGIYYACTRIEALIHDGEDVAVIGAGNSAGQAAMFLSENCARHVHILVRRSELSESMSDYLASRLKSSAKITIHYNTQATEVIGDRRIQGLNVQRNDGSVGRIDCSAVFVFIGARPNVRWMPPELATDEYGYVLAGPDVVQAGKWPLTERAPCPLETSIPGILAGGDVRTGTTKRVGFAVGDGSLACTCAHKLVADYAANG